MRLLVTAQFDQPEKETDVVPLPTEMVGGCRRCLTCFLICSSVLLLGPYDVEASDCQHIIHKKVGDTVELPSCLPTEEVTSARWKYNDSLIADKHINITEKQFKGRLKLNRMNFSLTVRKLTLQDSGNFSFVSAKNAGQRETITITLKVHEPITKPPVLTYNSTWHTLNKSCTVWLECGVATDSSVNYSWTVRNQTKSGSKLLYSLLPQDGDTTFTCTVCNFVSKMPASILVKCSNDTQEGSPENILLLSAAGGGCLMAVIILGIVVGIYYCKHSRPGRDSDDLTVYADITEVATEDVTMKPCSVYETIDNRVSPVTSGPQTVYDKIQLSRVKNVSVSPYQEIP